MFTRRKRSKLAVYEVTGAGMFSKLIAVNQSIKSAKQWELKVNAIELDQEPYCIILLRRTIGVPTDRKHT